jgi:8-oxo-dGTP pyrophosphatase MutT (NUDIX family)
VSDEPIPSAAVVVLRHADPFEVLLVRRNPRLRSYAGAWVFPGGRVDPSDGAGPLDAHREAGVRELEEETRLRLSPELLRPLSRWTTPARRPRRYRAWFFLAEHPGGEVRVDGSEIHEHRWLTPGAALEGRHRGSLILPPPVFVTLSVLAERGSLPDALTLPEPGPQRYDPRVAEVPGGHASLYEGDAGFRNGNGEAPGPRHRLWMLADGWRYERSG